MVRYNLPIVIVIVNNGGIYGGFDRETFDSIRKDGDLLKVYEFLSSSFFLNFWLTKFELKIKKILFHQNPTDSIDIRNEIREYDANVWSKRLSRS